MISQVRFESLKYVGKGTAYRQARDVDSPVTDGGTCIHRHFVSIVWRKIGDDANSRHHRSLAMLALSFSPQPNLTVLSRDPFYAVQAPPFRV